jgi:hypothetical protein
MCAALLAPRAAHAQGNYRSTPTGGRSALMGGTGIALARDGSAPLLNPAAIINIDDTGLAFSVNFYAYSSTRLSGIYQPGATDRAHFGDLSLPDTGLTSTRFDTLPSTLCLFINVPNVRGAPRDENGHSMHRSGRQRLALCGGNFEHEELSVAAARYQGTSGATRSNSTMSFNRKWNRFFAGPSYGLYVTDDVAVGLSLHAINTTYAADYSVSNVTQDGSGHAITSDFDMATNAFSLDLGAVAGVVWKVDKHYSLGVSASSPIHHVASSYDATFGNQYAGAGQFALLRAGHDGTFIAHAPLRVGAGLGAEYGRVRIETDVAYFFPRDEARRADVHFTQQTVTNGAASNTEYDYTVVEKDDGVVDAAFGLEYFVNPGLSLLGGASTDFSAIARLPESPSESSIAEQRVHRVGASFGLGSYGPGTELLFGAEASYGWGRSFAVDPFVLPSRLATVEQTTFTLMFIVAGSTSLANLRRAADTLGSTVRNAVERR